MPRTKFLSPYPSARFDGRLTIDGEEVELAQWPGMIGHNWGAEHAERWVWIQGAFLDEDEPTYFDMAAGRIKIGPVTTPWVANGMLRIGDIEHRLGGFDRMLSTKVAEQPTSCRFQISGKGVKLRGRVGLGAAQLRRLGIRGPEGPRAQHAELLDRRPGAGGRAGRAPAAAPGC